MKKIILKLLAVPMLLGLSDYIYMYTFNGIIDNVLLITAVSVLIIVFVYNTVLIVKSVRQRQTKSILAYILIEIYVLMYLFIVLTTYIGPYLITYIEP